jgi:transcriptional regulator with XRE-family HTH domain
MNEAEARILRDLIRSMRLNAGLRQQDVADRLGQPQSYVSKCESGERRVDVVELAAICRACNSDLPTFVDRLVAALPKIVET